MGDKTTVLIVDDDEFNREILTVFLRGAGYLVVSAHDGRQALDRLVTHPEIDLVLLDRMMPDLDGLEVLKRIKSDPRRRDLPVIMQTAMSTTASVLACIREGAFYYLAKPYEEATLLAIVEAACVDLKGLREIREAMAGQQRSLALMDGARFHFRTLDQIKSVAHTVAGLCPDPARVIFGLHELMLNAVEHGNLGITYAEKTALVRTGVWQWEVERRLALPEHRDKHAVLEFESRKDDVMIVIRDQGAGFHWLDYLEISPHRAADPHGRGVAMARAISFSSLEFRGSGNEVACIVSADQQA
jgi:CheY-like chemotaxis protein